MIHYHPCDLTECAASGYQPPPATVADAIAALPRTNADCLVWMRDHKLSDGASIEAVFSAVRADLRKLAGGEDRG